MKGNRLFPQFAPHGFQIPAMRNASTASGAGFRKPSGNEPAGNLAGCSKRYREFVIWPVAAGQVSAMPRS